MSRHPIPLPSRALGQGLADAWLIQWSAERRELEALEVAARDLVTAARKVAEWGLVTADERDFDRLAAALRAWDRAVAPQGEPTPVEPDHKPPRERMVMQVSGALPLVHEQVRRESPPKCKRCRGVGRESGRWNDLQCDRCGGSGNEPQGEPTGDE
jgi:hypothetical protein